MKNFKLTDETKVINGVTFHQIEAIKDMPIHGVKAGDKGGWIEKESNISGNAWVYGDAQVSGDAKVYGDAQVSGDAKVYGNAWVYGDAQVSGDAKVYGNAKVFGNAQVSGNADICFMSCFGSSNRTTTAFMCADKIVRVKCGCFYGDLTEFENQIKETHGDNKYAKQYIAMIELIKAKFELE